MTKRRMLVLYLLMLFAAFLGNQAVVNAQNGVGAEIRKLVSALSRLPSLSSCQGQFVIKERSSTDDGIWYCPAPVCYASWKDSVLDKTGDESDSHLWEDEP